MKQSAKFSWNSSDTKAFMNQALRVIAPYLVVIIPVLLTQIDDSWAYSAVTIYVLNRIYDALRRYIQGK